MWDLNMKQEYRNKLLGNMQFSRRLAGFVNVKLNFVCLVMLFFLTNSNAQTPSKTLGDTLDQIPNYEFAPRIYSDKLALSIYATSGSRGVSQYFLNRAMFGGYVNPEGMDKSVKLLNGNINAVGIDYGIRLNWNNCIKINMKSKSDSSKKSTKYLGLAVEQRSIIGAGFSEDWFKLAFKGNLYYEGETLDLKKLNAKMISYRKLSLILNSRLIMNGSKLYLQLNDFSLIQGLNYAKINSSNSQLNTSVWGDSVTGKIDGSYESREKNNAAGIGWGIATGFSMRLGFKTYFSISDLGIMKINQINLYTKNGKFGMHQQPLLRGDFISDVFSRKIKDTLKRSLSFDSTQTSRWVMLPFNLRLERILNDDGKKIVLSYLNMPGYLPEVAYFHNYYRALKRKLIIYPSVAIGGFDFYNLNTNLQYLKECKDCRFAVSLDIKGIEGFLLPKQQHGSGVFLKLSFQQ